MDTPQQRPSRLQIKDVRSQRDSAISRRGETLRWAAGQTVHSEAPGDYSSSARLKTGRVPREMRNA